MDNAMFQSIVNKLENTIDKNGDKLNMDSIIISHGESLYMHNFKETNEFNDLRSLSKPIIALALGIAIDDGLKLGGKAFNLDAKIYPFFESKVPIANTKNLPLLRQVTLRHVLTHSIGYADGLLFSKDIKDIDPFNLLEYVLNYDIVYPPGERFVYSNVGPYILSALIQEEVGINLSEWVRNILFNRIGIEDFVWKNYGNYCAAATGLKLTHTDLHKIGLLLLNKGKHGNTQIVSSDWVEAMTTFQIGTPDMYDEKRVFPKFGYGFYVYICKNGNYFIDGTDGQYIIVIPRKQLLITTFGHQGDMKPITECFRELS